MKAAVSPTRIEEELQSRLSEVREVINGHVSDGLKRLPIGPLREELTRFAEPLLTQLALGLIRDDRGPLDGVHSPARVVEEALTTQLDKARASADRRAASRATEPLRLLLSTFGELCIQAGWLIHEQSGILRFANENLPSLLVGNALVQEARQNQKTRHRLGRHAAWANAALVMAALGDPVDAWVELMLQESDPILLRERLIVTCGALGGLVPGTEATPALRQAFHVVIATLIWLAPAWRDAGARIGRHAGFREEPSAWYLEQQQYLWCIKRLAYGSQAVGGELSLPPARALWEKPPPPLGPLLAALALPRRLSDAEARTVVALCTPAEGLRLGLIGPEFWEEFFGIQKRLWYLTLNSDWSLQWLRDHGAPQLEAAGMLTALVIPGTYAPAGMLMSDAALLPVWYRAWTKLLAEDPGEPLAQAWAEAAQRAGRIEDEDARKLIYTDGPALLRGAGLWAKALAALRSRINLRQVIGYLRPEPDSSVQVAREAALLRLCAFTDAEWVERIAATPAEEIWGWRVLLEAGAPAAAVADILVKQLPRQVREDWKPAFPQIRWLLESGPQEALSALAPLGELPDEALAPLTTWEPGPWLDRLCAADLPWPAPLQQRIWRRLAGFSEHLDVRRRCTSVLLAAMADKGASHA